MCDTPTFVQAEGGPTLNGSLFAADVVDEINVTTSPLTVGGSGPRLSVGGADHAHRFELAQLLTDDESFVYSRWLRQRNGASGTATADFCNSSSSRWKSDAASKSLYTLANRR